MCLSILYINVGNILNRFTDLMYDSRKSQDGGIYGRRPRYSYPKRSFLTKLDRSRLRWRLKSLTTMLEKGTWSFVGAQSQLNYTLTSWMKVVRIYLEIKDSINSFNCGKMHFSLCQYRDSKWDYLSSRLHKTLPLLVAVKRKESAK